MAGWFELLREVLTLTSAVSRLEKDNEQLRSSVRGLEARLALLESAGDVVAERAARAASEAAIESYIPILERLIRLENSTFLDQKIAQPKAGRLISRGP